MRVTRPNLIRQALKNSRGQSLIQVMVSVAIMSILLAAFATMTVNQSKEASALSQKLGASDLQNAMSTALENGNVCLTAVGNKTFDATKVGTATPPVITPNPNEIRASVQPVLGPIVAAAGSSASPYSSATLIKTIELDIISGPAPSGGPGDTYMGKWVSKLDPKTLVRAIVDPAVTVQLTVDTTKPTAAKITGCKGGSGCWIKGANGLYTTDCGNVGIGTTTPSAALDVFGATTPNGFAGIFSEAKVAGGATGICAVDDKTNIYGCLGGVATPSNFGPPDTTAGDLILSSSQNLRFSTGAAGWKVNNAVAVPATKMSIMTNGFVGIGTGAPTTSLTVYPPGAGPGTLSSSIPIGWGGGLHTWDVFANGTVGVGPNTGNTLAAYMNSAGDGHFSRNVTVDGTIRPGGAASGGGCAPEGAFAYDWGAHQPVYCSNTGKWSTMGGSPPGTLCGATELVCLNGAVMANYQFASCNGSPISATNCAAPSVSGCPAGYSGTATYGVISNSGGFWTATFITCSKN